MQPVAVLPVVPAAVLLAVAVSAADRLLVVLVVLAHELLVAGLLLGAVLLLFELVLFVVGTQPLHKPVLPAQGLLWPYVQPVDYGHHPCHHLIFGNKLQPPFYQAHQGLPLSQMI
jgi:hypothetical protein